MSTVNTQGENLPPYVVCPRCHGPLDSSERGVVVCSICSARYHRGMTISFTERLAEAEKERQRSIYDGEGVGGTQLSYQEIEQYHNYLRYAENLVRISGIVQTTLKEVKNHQMVEWLRLQPGEHVLDIGSGDGVHLAMLSWLYHTRGTGIDIAPLAVHRCLQLNPLGHDYYIADAEQLPFADHTFDAIISLDVLEHLPRPSACITEAFRALRPGGRALFYAISQRDTYSWHWQQRRLTGGRLGRDEIGGHRWESFVQPDDAYAWAQQAGFGHISIEPFHALFSLILDERFPTQLQELGLYPRLLRMLLALAEMADRPLTRRGFGNGFYLCVAKREPENSHRCHGNLALTRTGQ